jgi:hypothetical protein
MILGCSYGIDITTPNGRGRSADKGQVSVQSRASEKKIASLEAWFIIVYIFPKEVIPGASTRAHYSQEVLKPRCSGGLGKAHIPKALDEAGEDRLG